MSHDGHLNISTSRIRHSASKDFYHYQGASYKVILPLFKEAFALTGNIPFIDIGCGKGRAAFVAERCGYDNITGIELEDELVKQANENLDRFNHSRSISHIRFIHANALEFGYPEGPTVYFLFNPFSGEILARVLDKIVAAAHKDTWFIYMNPKFSEKFDHRFTTVKKITTGFYREALILKLAARSV
jgi:SAM-dependent methyltransferase